MEEDKSSIESSTLPVSNSNCQSTNNSSLLKQTHQNHLLLKSSHLLPSICHPALLASTNPLVYPQIHPVFQSMMLPSTSALIPPLPPSVPILPMSAMLTAKSSKSSPKQQYNDLSVSNATNSKSPEDLKSRIFIGNINTSVVTKSLLHSIFSPYGDIKAISMHKGYAFIQYGDEMDALNAVIGQDGQMLSGQVIDVNLVTSPKAHQKSVKKKRLQHQDAIAVSTSSPSTSRSSLTSASSSSVTSESFSRSPSKADGGTVSNINTETDNGKTEEESTQGNADNDDKCISLPYDKEEGDITEEQEGDELYFDESDISKDAIILTDEGGREGGESEIDCTMVQELEDCKELGNICQIEDDKNLNRMNEVVKIDGETSQDKPIAPFNGDRCSIASSSTIAPTNSTTNGGIKRLRLDHSSRSSWSSSTDTYTPNVSCDLSTADIMICGRCRSLFTSLTDFLSHKQSSNPCRLRFVCRCRE